MKVNNSSDSSSGYTNAAYSSKGIAGLASGIDTESVVQAMLMTEQNKIDKQTQQQQILEWKQDAYRDVITKINDFQDKYFNLTSDSCIRLTSLYNTQKSESSSKAVTVTPSSSAVEGDFTMQVAQLATSASVTSSKASSNVSMTTTDSDKASGFKFSRDVKITIGETEHTVKLENVSDLEGIVNAVNRDVGSDIASISESVTVKDKNNKAVTYKLFDGDKEYKGTVKVSSTTTYTSEDGSINLTKDAEGKYWDDSRNEYTGEVKSHTEVAFTKEDGTTPLEVKYYNNKDKEITDADDIAALKFSEDVTKELSFDAGGSEMKISGSSAGMAILGLSGTVKNSEENPVISSKNANAEYSTFGKVNGTIEFTLDGITKKFSIGEAEEGINTMDELKDKVIAAFGDAVKFEEVKDGEGNPTGNYNISANGIGRQLTISANADTMEAMGFAEGTKSISSQIRRTDTLASLGVNATEGDDNDSGTFSINGVEIEYKNTDTVSSLMKKINDSDAGVKISYNDLNATFKLESKSTGTGFNIELSGDTENIFGKLGFSIDSGTGSFTGVKQGQNAIVNINGTTVERSSNKMNYNGQLIDLNATTGKYQKNEDGSYKTDENGELIAEVGTVDQKAEITSERDVDKAYDTLKAFVDDYNSLIEDLNKMIHEDANYKKYPPLTENQKKEMTENEIKLWEEKSKQGLLRNDKDISSFLQDMRSAMYTKGDSQYILSSIGINSSSQWSDYGKLSIDEDTLKSALKNNASEVTKLFTGDNGLATRLNNICSKTANTSSGSRGALVIRAGVKGKATEKDNEIYDQLQSIKEKLEKLNAKYESRKERLWKQFNAMEEAISKANSQSDYFANWM